MAAAQAAATTTISPPRRKSSSAKRPAAVSAADDSDDSDGASAAKRTKNGDGGAPEHSDVSSLSWSLEELGQLVGNLAACLPAHDLVKYSTMVEKVDWERVRFGPYSAAQCKDKWAQLMGKLRRYRTLTDLVGDAREWLRRPWLPGNGTARRQQRGGGGAGGGRHPGLPKKPLTPYFRYFLEKREKYARDHPDLSMTELAKVISNKFQELPDKKKQKYKESFDRDNDVYKMELKKFKKENPDAFPEANSKQHPAGAPPPMSVPEKPQTPIQLFTVDRLKKPDLAKLDKREAQEEIRKQWAELSDGKRLKWIRRALQDQQRYEMEVAEYSQAFPDFKAATKPILSKAEQEFKDKCDGKPERPPNSGYSLFSRIMLRQLKDVPAKEKMAEISQLWKNLSQGERDSYNKQATKANAKYKEKYAAYLSNLPEEERQKVEAEAAAHKSSASAGAAAKGNGKAANHAVAGAGGKGGVSRVAPGDENRPPAGERPKPKKPLSAMFFFQQEKLAAMKERCPQMSHQEVMRALAREFSELPDRKKEKYKKMATEAKEKAIEETNGHKVKEEKTYQAPSAPSLNRRNRLFKGEPKKPPQSGYGVFSTEMLSQLVDVDPKNRMAEIAKRWNAMPDADKERYKRAVQDLQRKYNKELARFLEGLSPEDRMEYEARRARMKAKRKGGAIKAAATRKEKRRKAAAAADSAKEKEEDGSSDESSSEESSDEDEDDDDEEEEEEDGEEEGEEKAAKSDDDDDSDSSSEEEEEEESESGSSDSSSSDDSDDAPAAPTIPAPVAPTPKQAVAVAPKKQQMPVIKKEEAPSLPAAVVKVEPNNKKHGEEDDDDEDSSESESESSSDSSDDDDDDDSSGSDSKD